MCRLFGMTSAPARVRATFWLLEAPDSLSAQSRRDPDGTGLGFFGPDGRPEVHKAPIAAFDDRDFAEEARTVESATFVAHVRYASTGELADRNTHPFSADGRLFAHNGVIEGLDKLEQRLGADGMAQVQGDTDSERFFALVNQETAARGGNVGEGLAAAARWVAANLPVFALNVVMITADELWALRYPETHSLYVLDRRNRGPQQHEHLDHKGAAGRLHVHSGDLADAPAVVVASEKLDDDPLWRPLESGELLHVGPDLQVSSHIALPDPPAHLLTLDDLQPKAASSQSAA
ncbi:MAG TPA: class II glutamine amidotransferase [Actinocrinis sp.]|nr:class II glutamine amidotransferase [Actinocrinis sp.]